MKIRSVRPVLLSHDYGGQSALAWVGGRIETWDAALVEITTEDGTRGVGEVAQGIMGAATVPGIVAALTNEIVGLDIDDPTTVGDTLRAATAFWSRGGITSGVIAAVEVAALDAVGKARGVPAFELLGAAPHDQIEVYASGGLGTDEQQVIDWCKRMEDDGFRTVKFRAMTGPDRTIGLVDAVTEVLSPTTTFVLDAVQGCARQPWLAEDVLRVGKHLEALGPRWFEEPCHADDVDGYAAMRDQLDVPISGVESYSTRGEFERLLSAGGADIIQPDVGMVGGPTEFQRIVARAFEAGADCVPHIWATGVNLMASVHAAFATPRMDLIELCMLPNPLREALLVEPLRVDNSWISRPQQPGLGVELTPEIEERYPFQPGRGHVIH
ncbi:mandelate racemase/muconate lactonizing enzyme family protein [Streptomyces tubercidicus]